MSARTKVAWSASASCSALIVAMCASGLSAVHAYITASSGSWCAAVARRSGSSRGSPQSTSSDWAATASAQTASSPTAQSRRAALSKRSAGSAAESADVPKWKRCQHWRGSAMQASASAGATSAAAPKKAPACAAESAGRSATKADRASFGDPPVYPAAASGCARTDITSADAGASPDGAGGGGPRSAGPRGAPCSEVVDCCCDAPARRCAMLRSTSFTFTSWKRTLSESDCCDICFGAPRSSRCIACAP